MAIGLTDDIHYKTISNAIRALHGGAETYTPAEMGEYLGTQGAALKPENVKKGVTIFGVTGNYEVDVEGAYNNGYKDGQKDATLITTVSWYKLERIVVIESNPYAAHPIASVSLS